jgi:hypothetical protein
MIQEDKRFWTEGGEHPPNFFVNVSLISYCFPKYLAFAMFLKGLVTILILPQVAVRYA